ncbi:MAG: hypothetical protein WD185_09835, partial [Sneathiella sp.]
AMASMATKKDVFGPNPIFRVQRTNEKDAFSLVCCDSTTTPSDRLGHDAISVQGYRIKPCFTVKIPHCGI